MATNATTKRKQQQRQALVRIFIMLGIIICANVLASYFNYGLDLTTEKRFTLSKPTQKLLRSMKDVVVVDVYLKGKFPAGFQRLQEATRQKLQSFKDEAGGHVVIRFINPFEDKSEAEQQKIFAEFEQKGIGGINVQTPGEEEGYVVKPIFPWAIVRYNGRERPVQLLEDHFGMSPMENLNISESMLEYKFAKAIHDVIIPDVPRIAYIVGNGEPLGVNTLDALTSVSKLYHLDTVDLTRGTHLSIAYDAIIIAKPTIRISDTEKLKLDQYVMNGGKVLWYADMLNTPMDSLRTSPQFIALDYGLNVDDLLFKFGVRVNSDLVEDHECEKLPRVSSVNNNRPDITLRPWIYFPVLYPTSNHPIVRNMEPVLAEFANSIDTLNDPYIKKTILLQSSKYSRTTNSPARVSLSTMNFNIPAEQFNKPFRTVAVLLQGQFSSLFKNRLAPEFVRAMDETFKHPYKSRCDSTNSIIVVADGEMMLNDYTAKTGPLEMGYYQYTHQYYANKSFFLNCLEYLTDNSGILEARSKGIKLRLLDAARAKNEKNKWQVINVTFPIALVLVFASCYIFFRKRRYEVKE